MERKSEQAESLYQKYYHVDSLDWLKEQEASNLIESLKKMTNREADMEAVVP